MVRKRESVPSLNDLVIGTVAEIHDHGAFVTLDEYGGLRAYVPLGEVSHTWFRSIREVLRVGQKAVFKVIRVDPARRLVDLSLRRVSDAERREKLIEWKRAQRAEKILELAAQKLRKTLDEAYEKVGWRLEDHYGEIFKGLEEASLRGEEALLEAGVDERWAKAVAEIARQNIKLPRVKMSYLITLQCVDGGLPALKKALTAWEEAVEVPQGVTVRFYTLGAPRYKIDIEALNYRDSERLSREILKSIESAARGSGCTFAYQKLKGE
ncbi:translation initiation factor IF-2 subunit alpha [Infirmifilum sp. SLHALR2]